MKAMQHMQQLYLLGRKHENNNGYVSEVSRYFLSGLVIYKGKELVKVPHMVIILTSLGTIAAVLTYNMLNPEKADWFNNCLDFPMFGTSAICSIVILYYKERIISLGKDVDSWWKYPFLEEEIKKKKKEVEDWMVWYGTYYFSGLYLAYIAFLLPLAKPLIMDRQEDTAKELPVPCWSPLPLDTWWGFHITYFFEMIGLYFSYLLYGRTCFYLMAVSITIGHQVELIGNAMLTLEERVSKMLEQDGTISVHSLHEKYKKYLEREIVQCVKHYQTLQRYSGELARVFAVTTNTTYNLGMFAVCVLAVRFATSDENMDLISSSAIMIGALAQQYIYSLASELLIEKVEGLRKSVYGSKWFQLPLSCQKIVHLMQIMSLYMPTLKTVLGTKTNMENLSKVINTSYCYFSFIISLKNKEVSTNNHNEL